MKRISFKKILTTLIACAALVGLYARPPAGKTDIDTLMRRIFDYASRENLHIGHFESNVYTKFRINSHVRNFTLKLLPHSFDVSHGRNVYYGESLTHYEYVDFGVSNRKDVAFYSTARKLRKMPEVLQGYVNAFIYEPEIYRDHLLSPFNKRNRHSYKYRIESETEDKTVRVAFEPRYGSSQLVKGSAVVDYDSGKIAEVVFEALCDNILHVRVNLTTGNDGVKSLLPKKAAVDLRYNFGGNVIGTHLDSQIEYRSTSNFNYADSIGKIAGKKHRDITFLNLISHDTAGIVRNRDFFDCIRPHPLGSAHDSAYVSHAVRASKKDSMRTSITTRAENLQLLEDVLLDRHDVSFGNTAMLAIPPVFTPSMFQWSGTRGFSLQARLRLYMNLSGGKALKLSPRIGYSFKQKQLYWNIPLDVMLIPALGAGLEAKIRNGNHIYSSLQAKEVRHQLNKIGNYDSMLNVFDKYDFNYYNDFHTAAAFYMEPVVGLKFSSGLSFHHRRMINWNDVASVSNMKRSYKSIAPYIEVEITPRLYYRRTGNRRIAMYSRYPTFRLSYERGVKMWGCDNKYERTEADASYVIKLPAFNSVFLRAGGGIFTDREDMYFVDYENFSYRNMPIGWEDDMLGEFQILDRHWYNESRFYALFCSAYESPMLLFAHIPLVGKVINRERIYLNTVMLQELNPYVECGYGVSTNLFDGALFVGAANGSGMKIGAKLSLRFFDRW